MPEDEQSVLQSPLTENTRQQSSEKGEVHLISPVLQAESQSKRKVFKI